MSQPSHFLGMYLYLANASQRRQRPQVRDKFLVLAGVVAQYMGLPLISEYCRHLVLQHNPAHMLSRWGTLAEALEDNDFLLLLKQIQRRYPQEKAERMLVSLGIDMARERATFSSDQEYAASLLGVAAESLGKMFGDGPP